MQNIYYTYCDKSRSHEFLFFILDKFYNLKASDASLSKSPYGKLYLTDNSLNFNISHTGEFLAVAIFDNEVGLDVEQIKEKDFSRVSKKYFGNTPKDEKEFFTLWTKAESFIKYKAKSVLTELKKIEIDGDGFIYDGVKQDVSSKTVFISDYVLSVTSEKLDFELTEIKEF